MGREGFEPPKAKPADLQSAAFNHFATCPRAQPAGSAEDYHQVRFPPCVGLELALATQLEPAVGIEPTTGCLQSRGFPRDLRSPGAGAVVWLLC